MCAIYKYLMHDFYTLLYEYDGFSCATQDTAMLDVLTRHTKQKINKIYKKILLSLSVQENKN
jgi:hypothetical protein